MSQYITPERQGEIQRVMLSPIVLEQYVHQTQDLSQAYTKRLEWDMKLSVYRVVVRRVIALMDEEIAFLGGDLPNAILVYNSITEI